MKKLLILVFLIINSAQINAYTIRISQLDPSNLLLNQKVDAYISVTKNGVPVRNLHKKNFTVYESAFNNKYIKVPIRGFKHRANHEQGINFLLLVDNSGSMYKTLNGRVTKNVSQQRITIAKKAVQAFLNSVKNPKDNVGLAVFNSYYTQLTSPDVDKQKTFDGLNRIIRPDFKSGYTEIYASICQAVKTLNGSQGRKVIIVLSDGRNKYYSLYQKKPHHKYGTKLFRHTESIKDSLKSGASIFVINFGIGQMKDTYLGHIAKATGGLVFEANSGQSLNQMYRKIANLVINEYRLTYTATMHPADIKNVKVFLNKKQDANMYYFSSTVFGLPRGIFLWLLFPLLFAIFLLWLLTKLKSGNMYTGPGLEVLERAKTVVFDGIKKGVTMPLSSNSKTMIGLGEDKTIISSNAAKITGDKVTIMFDNNRQSYILKTPRPIKVNNNRVTRKVLNSGDVININNKTIVFDAGVE
ncbi:MAG: VWA domain-containing protein [Spirochaetes bacterium]|nr:VWA domain-containing protein [Spirochaetota bacterium]